MMPFGGGRDFPCSDGDAQDDRACVLAAVGSCGKALEFASDELQADREVALAAVAEDGYALSFAGSALRGDREVVLAACETAEVLDLATPELRAALKAEGISPKKPRKSPKKKKQSSA